MFKSIFLLTALKKPYKILKKVIIFVFLVTTYSCFKWTDLGLKKSFILLACQLNNEIFHIKTKYIFCKVCLDYVVSDVLKVSFEQLINLLLKLYTRKKLSS